MEGLIEEGVDAPMSAAPHRPIYVTEIWAKPPEEAPKKVEATNQTTGGLGTSQTSWTRNNCATIARMNCISHTTIVRLLYPGFILCSDPGSSGPSVPELVPMVLEAFQDARMVQPPILTTPLASDRDAGTQYMYANEPLFNVQLDSPGSHVASGNEGYYVDESDMIATVSGTCTRTDPNTGNETYVGRAYCQYSYHFLDEFGNVEAGLIAEGVVQIGDYSTLSITGGSGIFRGTVGTIILESGTIGSGNNPTFVPDPMLDLPSSYLVNMFVFMDPLSLAGHKDISY
jgi:hypothetical protein